MERFKVRRRVMPPPVREFLYLESDEADAYYVTDPKKGEPKGRLTARQVLEHYEPLDADRTEELEDLAAAPAAEPEKEWAAAKPAEEVDDGA